MSVNDFDGSGASGGDVYVFRARDLWGEVQRLGDAVELPSQDEVDATIVNGPNMVYPVVYAASMATAGTTLCIGSRPVDTTVLGTAECYSAAPLTAGSLP